MGLDSWAEENSDLTASPLPGEIAGLINAMRKRYDDVLAEPVADALEQQAREIERLNVILANHGVTQLEKTEIMLAHKDRIRQLEAERDALHEPALPAEIAIIVPWLNDKADLLDEAGIADNKFRRAAAALQQQVRENATLRHWHECERARADAAQAELTSETGHMNARIKELEAERDRLQAELRVCYKLPLTMGHPIAQKLAAERDAIEAATIERILALIPGGTHCDPQEIADSIRVLAKPSAETE
jgi:DNA repair exonuclease SbcCD ATPase subunit